MGGGECFRGRGRCSGSEGGDGDGDGRSCGHTCPVLAPPHREHEFTPGRFFPAAIRRIRFLQDAGVLPRSFPMSFHPTPSSSHS